MKSVKSYNVAADHLAVAKAHARPHCDLMGIYGAVRVESGLPFRQEECLKEHETSRDSYLALVIYFLIAIVIDQQAVHEASRELCDSNNIGCQYKWSRWAKKRLVLRLAMRKRGADLDTQRDL